MINVKNGRDKTVVDTLFDPEKGVIAYNSIKISSNDLSFVFSASKTYSDIWVVENFDPDIK